MQRNYFTVLFFLKKSKLLKNGEAPICMRITINGKRAEIQIKRGIDVAKWNAQKECWESYTDITVNLNSLPPFHAYVDNRDSNRHVHDFLTSNRIAEPAGFEYQGFRMFRFNPDRLKELVPEQFKTISAKLPSQDDMIKDIIYQERRFPLRTVQDNHGIYLVSSKELEESLIEGVRKQDVAANELLDGICLFCSTQELRYLTDAELIETIYAQ